MNIFIVSILMYLAVVLSKHPSVRLSASVGALWC